MGTKQRGSLRILLFTYISIMDKCVIFARICEHHGRMLIWSKI